MPNHVINELVFRDVSGDQRADIFAACCDADGKVDFTILVPTPLNVWQGSCTAADEKAFRQTWYTWNRENWGTKWNAYSHKPTEQTLDTLVLRFETAWSPPYPWLAAVFNKLSLPFEHNWLDEGASWGRSGRFYHCPSIGKRWQEGEASEAVHRHLHLLHWGVEQFDDEDSPPITPSSEHSYDNPYRDR